MSEDIENPKRYTHTKLECWDFWIKAGLNPLIASAVKYVWRYKYKNGVEDIDKAQVFLDKAFNTKDVYYSGVEFEINKEDFPGFTEHQLEFLEGAVLTTKPNIDKVGMLMMNNALKGLMIDALVDRDKGKQNND